MNIFRLDDDPKLAAEFCFDAHSIKMCLESMQILSTNVRHILGNVNHPSLMKSTHANHPSTVWARDSSDNMQWLIQHTEGLFETYSTRYHKVHASEGKFYDLMPLFDDCCDILNNQGKIEQTPFALAMPDECKVGNVVESYRAYYKHKAAQEIDKVNAYLYALKHGKKERKPALKFVWQKTSVPHWVDFMTADLLLGEVDDF